LDGKPDAEPPVPPSIMVWHSVRSGRDTKTKKSRRTLALPKRCVEALRFHHVLQAQQRRAAGKRWQEHDLVFASTVGTERNANNVLRSFRAILRKTNLVAEQWTPRDLRHSFVSVLSHSGMPIEEISRLVGHNSTEVTETVYRHQIRPVLLAGAEAMNDVFPEADKNA
jgi:integrase